MPLTTLGDCETRLDGFSTERKQQFLTLFEQCKSFPLAAETCGVSITTAYRHLEHDEWFAQQVQVVKRKLAWSLVPRQYERAMANSTTDSIWLQKVLGGAEFNPDKPIISVAVGLIGLSNRAPSPSLPASSVPIAISSTVLPSLIGPSVPAPLSASVSPSVDQAHTPASRPGTSQATSSP